MKLRKLVRDDDAVSPVIGVILMVAITVILAAVIASFVLGLGNTSDVAPTASFSTSYDAGANELELTHTGGDPIRQDELYLRGENLAGNGGPWSGDATGSAEGHTAIVSGNSQTLTGLNNDYVLRVVWQSTDTDKSTELYTDRGRNA